MLSEQLEKLSFFGSDKKTNWALLALIILMPLRNIQIQYLPNFGAGLNMVNILFIIALLHAMRHGNRLDEPVRINKILVWYILSSIFALFMGYLFLDDLAHGNWNKLKDQLLPVFIVFIVQKSATDIIQWRRIMIAGVFSVIYCFRLVWNQYMSVSAWHYSDDMRIRGPFMDLGANEMGAYAVTAGLISIACLITTWKYKKLRIIFIIFTISAFGSVLYSYSRGAYLACIVGLFIIFVKYNKSAKLMFPAIVLVVITLFNLPASVEERFSSISADEGHRDESAQSRFVFWEIAFERFRDRPVFGFGYRTVTDPRINPYEMDTHNYFVKILVERGLVGMLVLLILLKSIWNMLREQVNWQRKDPLINGAILGMQGVLLALIVGNMFGDRFSHYPIMTIFWTFVGLISILPYIENNQPEAIYESDNNQVSIT